MAKVITFSTSFPKGHIRQGENTHFVEKFLKSIPNPFNPLPKEVKKLIDHQTWLNCTYKNHTIRAGNRFKKGDYFSPRIWGNDLNLKSFKSGPYHSKQITIATDTLITDCWDVVIFAEPNQTTICLPTEIHSQYQMLSLGEVAKNDGLTIDDFESWFNPKRKSIEFHGQIICWNEKIKY